MKKKIAISVISLCVVLLATSILAFANYTQETVFDIHENGVICSLKTYDETATGKVSIPENYEGIMVTGISENAFLKCKDVTEVIIPKTVVNIGEFSLGYIYNEKGEKVKKENFVIWGRANSEAQKYATENGFTFKVYLTTPKLSAAKNAAGGVAVSWVSTANSKGYNVYRKTAKSGWQKIAYVEGEHTKKYLDKTAKNGTDYIYTVKAVYDDAASGYDKVGVSVHYLATPTVTLTNTSKGVQVTWTKNPKATQYRVYKKAPSDKEWTRIKIVKANVLSYVDASAKSGKDSYYCVIAYEGSIKSSFETNKSIMFLNEPNVTEAKNSVKGVKVFWNKVNGAQKYRVYRKTDGSSWVKLADVSSATTVYTDTKAKAGVKYHYTVKAFSGKYTSTYKKGIYIYCVPHPELVNVKAATSGLTVSWKKVAVAEYYTIYRRIDNGEWQKIGATKNGATLSYTDKNVSSGVNYNYTVIAWYKKAKSSFDANGVTGVYFSSPKITSARCFKSQKIVIEWENVGGAQTYTIYKKENSGKYQAIKTVDANARSYTDTAIKVGSQYSYIVKATSYYGIVSGNSNVKCVRVLDLTKPMVALTYDDGPSNSATTRILNTLEKHNARATFFVVGSRVNSYKSQIKRAYDLNCEIANHTYNHYTLTSLSGSGVKSELSNTDARVKAITGENPVLMRPPGGSFNNSTVKNNTAYPIIMWSVDTRDWESRNASKIVSNIKNNVRDGSIVLMHDLYDSTASATETIVPWLIKNGYQIVTVTELMDAKGVTMKNGSAYYSAK